MTFYDLVSAFVMSAGSLIDILYPSMPLPCEEACDYETGDCGSETVDEAPDLALCAASSAGESDSSSELSTSSDPADDSEADPLFQARLRNREVRRPATIAKAAGIPFDSFMFDQLKHQHLLLRADDSVFCSQPGRPALKSWQIFRKRVTKDFRLASFLPIVTEASAIGLQTRGYASLAAAVCSPAPFLCAALHRMPMVKHEYVLLSLGGDAISGAFPGGPGGGKIFSMWLKPVGLVASKQQSPLFALPVAIFLGCDSSVRIARVCEEWKPSTCLLSLPPRIPIGDGQTAIPLIFVTGDYAFCSSVVSLARANRPFPTTIGRVPYYNRSLCWHCGVGGGHLYNRKLCHVAERGGLKDHTCVLGLPIANVYYAPVHAILNVFSQLLCDICFSFQRFSPPGSVHPVADHILSLFPRDQWDPLLTRAENRSKERKSRRPFHHIDPGFLFGFLRSEHAGRLTELLSNSPFEWSARDSSEWPYAEAAVLGMRPRRSALGLWLSSLFWFDTIIAGDADRCRLFGSLLMDLWFEMLSIARPIPPDVPCAVVPPPSFYVPLAGFGPASHLAICGMPRFIAFVRPWLPPSLQHSSFLKLSAEIWLEHVQAHVRRLVQDFKVSSKSRHRWASELLQRAVERTLVNLCHDDDPSDACAAADRADGEPSSGPALKRARGGAAPENRAYRSCDLSTPIPKSTYEPAYTNWEWSFVTASAPVSP